jgi:ubiquinone/menaquinone biosynthesis C-methylase UbiE
LDIGCNWGRWSIAAARKGFSVVGIDPSLGAVMAARRIANELNLNIKYLVADGRFLLFPDNHFKVAHSYSVLQHFSKDDARRTIAQISRVLEPGGLAKIQMANSMVFAVSSIKRGESFVIRRISKCDIGRYRN